MVPIIPRNDDSERREPRGEKRNADGTVKLRDGKFSRGYTLAGDIIMSDSVKEHKYGYESEDEGNGKLDEASNDNDDEDECQSNKNYHNVPVGNFNTNKNTSSCDIKGFNESHFGDSESNADLISEDDKSFSNSPNQRDPFVEDGNSESYNGSEEDGTEIHDSPGPRSPSLWAQRQFEQQQMYSAAEEEFTNTMFNDYDLDTVNPVMTEDMASWYTDPILTSISSDWYSPHHPPPPYPMGCPSLFDEFQMNSPHPFSVHGQIYVDPVDYDDYNSDGDIPILGTELPRPFIPQMFPDDGTENKENTFPANYSFSNQDSIDDGTLEETPNPILSNNHRTWINRYSEEHNRQSQSISLGPLRPVPSLAGRIPSVNVSSNSQRTSAHEWYSQVASHIEDVPEESVSVGGNTQYMETPAPPMVELEAFH